MAKCLRCNKFTLISVKLKDGRLCPKCFLELGFDSVMMNSFSEVPYDQIKDGSRAYFDYYRRRDGQSSPSVKFAHYGEERELVCTEEERQIYDNVCALFVQNKIVDFQPELVRVSDNYVTVKCGEWDLVRFKFTARARWLFFPVFEKASERHQIESPDDLFDYENTILKSLEHIRKYS